MQLLLWSHRDYRLRGPTPAGIKHREYGCPETFASHGYAEVYRKAQKHQEHEREVYRKQHEKTNTRKGIPTYREGDLVWLYEATAIARRLEYLSTNLTPAWSGPWIVHQVYGGMSATLMHAYNPTRTYTAHFTRLSPAAGFAEEDIYEVETLLDKKTGRDGREMILVRWSGYKRPTWVPRENLEEGARESLRALEAGILRKKEKEQRKEKRKKAQAEIEDRKRKAKQPASKKGEGGDVVGRAGQ